LPGAVFNLRPPYSPATILMFRNSKRPQLTATGADAPFIPEH
jgi:hypothetical protein